MARRSRVLALNPGRVVDENSAGHRRGRARAFGRRADMCEPKEDRRASALFVIGLVRRSQLGRFHDRWRRNCRSGAETRRYTLPQLSAGAPESIPMEWNMSLIARRKNDLPAGHSVRMTWLQERARSFSDASSQARQLANRKPFALTAWRRDNTGFDAPARRQPDVGQPRTMRVPVSPASARPIFSGFVIRPSLPPASR